MFEFVESHAVNQGVGLITNGRKKTKIGSEQDGKDKRLHREFKPYGNGYGDRSHNNRRGIIAYHAAQKHCDQENASDRK